MVGTRPRIAFDCMCVCGWARVCWVGTVLVNGAPSLLSLSSGAPHRARGGWAQTEKEPSGQGTGAGPHLDHPLHRSFTQQVTFHTSV